MKKYFLSSKKFLIVYILAVPVMALTSAFFAKAMEPLLDEAVLNQGSNAYSAIVAFMVIGCLDILACYIHKIYREKLRTSFLTELKKDVFSGIMKMDFARFRKEPSSYYVSLIQRDIRKISTDYYDSVCGIYRVLACFMVTFAILIWINPWLCLLNVLISFLSVSLPQMLGNKIEAASKKATDNAAEYQGVVSDALLGFNTIKIFSITDKIKEQIEKRNIKYEKSEYESIRINYIVSYISVICSQLGFMVTMAIGAVLVLKGKMTVGGVVAISQLIGGILAPFQELPMFITNLKSIKVVKEKIEKIIRENEEDKVAPDVDLADDFDVKLDRISVSYEEKEVLHDVSMNFKKNKKYVIVGESGCGKSTLAKLIVKMVNCDSGDLKIGNTKLDDLPDEQLYKIVNYMQQEVFLFDDTLWNNITLYQDYSKEEVEKIIDCVGLRDYVQELENGLFTKVNGNGYNLSGGQKQRIGIARSLLSGAKIIILDEITSNLDVVLEKKIEDTIFGLENVTVIMITHSLNKDTLNKAEQIFVLKNGKVYEEGTFSELMEQKGLLYGYHLIAE